MFNRAMVIGYLATADIPAEEKDVIRVRLGKHTQADGSIMAGCLPDIFSSHTQHEEFIAAWEASPGKFMDMSSQSTNGK